MGLRANESKRFRAEVKSKFWGASVDGDSGLVRPQLERIVPLAFVTAQVARLGAADRKLLEILAGGWTSVLQCRKRAMCLLEVLFAEIQRFDYGVVFQLSSEAVAELWSLIFLAPTFCTDLRTPVDVEFSLVDASSEMMAEVSSQIPPEFAAELVRHKLTKAAWSRLLSPLKAVQREKGLLAAQDEVPEGEEPVRAHPVWSQLAKSLQFEVKAKKKVKKKTHINLSELDAALAAELRHGRSKPSSRLLLGSDSQVVLGALVRGRSSSKTLNARLQRALPDVLGYNLYTCPQYVNTKENVADDRTRERDCRDPVEPIPPWLEAALSGNFEQMDEMLRAVALDELSLARMPKVHAVPAKECRLTSRRIELWRERVALQRLDRQQARSQAARTGSELSRRNFHPVAKSRPEPWLPRERLTAAAAELLREFPRAQFALPPAATAAEIFDKPGHLDLFSGCRGAAKALAKRSGRWVLCFDLKHSAAEDLLDKGNQKHVERLVELGVFLSLTAGPVCASFSRAVRPAVRTAAQPQGVQSMTENMMEKVSLGDAMSQWLAAFTEQCLLQKLVVWIENPALSFLWWQPEWQRLITEYNLGFYEADYCVFGTPWRKRTRFLTNSILKGERSRCCCQKPHLRLVGYSALHRCSWAKVAEPYPSRLSAFLAAAVCESLKPSARQRKLNIPGCAKSQTVRIGEAENLGPRPRRAVSHRGINLEEVKTVSQPTLILQARVLGKFHDWLQGELSDEAWFCLQQAPELQLHFVRAFGNWLFSEGEPMYLFRHLVVCSQQQFPGFRHVLAESWDLLTKWEIVEPVSHRPPMPRLVLDAFLTLALSWGWKRWAAITAAAFFGAMRVGEPLRARRKDLVLASEALLQNAVCFLKITAPKSGRRGKGKMQHARVTEPFAVQLLEEVFAEEAANSMLYPASAATYRQRWDKIAAALGIPLSCRLTPATLRAGGAVHMYHRGEPITNILWNMRLKHLTTLESYLQETAAENLLQELPVPTREAIRSCARMLPHVLRQVFPS